MDRTIRIFIASDRWQQAAGAERVLEYSIRKHATCPVDIRWMRSGDPGWEVTPDGRNGTWNIGREPGSAWPKKGWGTDFSAFRFAIPEVAGFTGRAVYMDVDMLVLGDVAELLEVPLVRPWVCCHPAMSDVSVIDCAAFVDKGWPTLEELKMFPGKCYHHMQRLTRLGLLSDTLPWDWNCRDSADDWKETTRLLHFTAIPWQPWHPYDTVRYTPHPKPAWVRRWLDEKDEADAATS